jgi:flagella basal body P-ring formation protein FlgA
MMFAAAVAMAGCLAVNAGSDRILAGDLAPAFPAMSALAADTPVGFMPAPGVTRVFHVPELRMLAARFHLDAAPSGDICLQRPVFPLEPERLLEAMRRTLPEAKIELLDYSKQSAPQGEVEFPFGGLRPGATAALWNGSVSYAGGRRFTIWAKVQVSVKARRVLAIGDLAAGRPIAAGQVMAAEHDEFPTSELFAASAEDVIGKWPRLAIRAGSAIRASQLEAAKEVARGDRVVVEVRNGAASLKIEGVALGPGAAGETILVRNPSSQKAFRARVEGKGTVSVDASPEPAGHTAADSSAPKVNP